MGNAIKPYHTASESTMVFDSHPCTAKAALRAYDGRPTVCSMNEYSDIFSAATDAFVDMPGYCGCCCGPPVKHHKELLPKLQSQYPHLNISIMDRWAGGRWQFVLTIRAKNPSLPIHSQETVFAPNAPAWDHELPSAAGPLPPPIPIPVVHGVFIEEMGRK